MSADVATLLFDGDCGFCRRRVRRWREVTKSAVAYRPYQEALTLFPEVTRRQCERAVQLVLPGHAVFSGAHAVLKALSLGGKYRRTLWLYEHLAPFARITELAYGIVARHRPFFSRLSLLLLAGGAPAIPLAAASGETDCRSAVLDRYERPDDARAFCLGVTEGEALCIGLTKDWYNRMSDVRAYCAGMSRGEALCLDAAMGIYGRSTDLKAFCAGVSEEQARCLRRERDRFSQGTALKEFCGGQGK